MNRDEQIRRIEKSSKIWDFLIIGGGATGLGCAVEAASRGHQVLLLEQADFSQGTSSRSTKLIHGGVRYLKQGNVSLVLEALHERGTLLKNAPHLVQHQAFVVPNYSWWEGPFYGIGLKLYDTLAGKLSLEKSRLMSREETLEKIPSLVPDDLKGGVEYYDGQFDDARLAITLVRTAEGLGGTLLNYFRVESLLKKGGITHGVVAVNTISGERHDIQAQAVINATGAYVDAINRMDDPASEGMIAPSQGIHLVLGKSFLPGKRAIMVPHTEDGRVMFAVPWHERVIVGTTETPLDTLVLEPSPLAEEIEFLLSAAATYLIKAPGPEDVLSVFAGIRPLIKSGGDKRTAALSRDHHISISSSGLITVAGGKWTTYRKMGEDTIDMATHVAGEYLRPSATEHLNLDGWSTDASGNAPYEIYGNNARYLKQMVEDDPTLDELIHHRLPYRFSEVIWAIREEMAMNLEDVLSRRTRSLLLDARASIEAAPRVAKVMAREMGRDEMWQEEQVSQYGELARNYLV